MYNDRQDPKGNWKSTYTLFQVMASNSWRKLKTFALKKDDMYQNYQILLYFGALFDRSAIHNVCFVFIVLDGINWSVKKYSKVKLDLM